MAKVEVEEAAAHVFPAGAREDRPADHHDEDPLLTDEQLDRLLRVEGDPRLAQRGQRRFKYGEPRGADEEEREPERLWQIKELQFAAISGVFLLAAVIAGFLDAAGPVVLTLEAVALLAGAYTFVPSTLGRLAKGKIGVGTLMTIAAVGAVILGEVGEAAMLAFLFSISEGLEEYSLARTRRGLRALLSLVPDEATVLVLGGATMIHGALRALRQTVSWVAVGHHGAVQAHHHTIDRHPCPGAQAQQVAGRHLGDRRDSLLAAIRARTS